MGNDEVKTNFSGCYRQFSNAFQPCYGLSLIDVLKPALHCECRLKLLWRTEKNSLHGQIDLYK